MKTQIEEDFKEISKTIDKVGNGCLWIVGIIIIIIVYAVIKN